MGPRDGRADYFWNPVDQTLLGGPQAPSKNIYRRRAGGKHDEQRHRIDAPRTRLGRFAQWHADKGLPQSTPCIAEASRRNRTTRAPWSERSFRSRQARRKHAGAAFSQRRPGVTHTNMFTNKCTAEGCKFLRSGFRHMVKQTNPCC